MIRGTWWMISLGSHHNNNRPSLYSKMVLLPLTVGMMMSSPVAGDVIAGCRNRQRACSRCCHLLLKVIKVVVGCCRVVDGHSSFLRLLLQVPISPLVAANHMADLVDQQYTISLWFKASWLYLISQQRIWGYCLQAWGSWVIMGLMSDTCRHRSFSGWLQLSIASRLGFLMMVFATGRCCCRKIISQSLRRPWWLMADWLCCTAFCFLPVTCCTAFFLLPVTYSRWWSLLSSIFSYNHAPDQAWFWLAASFLFLCHLLRLKVFIFFPSLPSPHFCLFFIYALPSLFLNLTMVRLRAPSIH